ncbi:transporter substrate-binding domain-containing protein, partial [Piscirickettsia salmonis]|uniref:transporter substrate-binding domain-containing protein n=1 Tax=Piscirickettsia salmonis TaxID=1238 RepID=UPI001C54D58E
NISGRILQAAVALALAAGATGAHADATLDKIKERGTVTIGVLANGGVFGSIDPATQQLVGWNPDLARELAKGLGVKAELVQVQTATRTQFLISGKVDLLIASMELNPERAEILGYAPTPFFRVGGAAATRKDSGIAKWEDLRGKPVCVSQGSSFARPLQADYGAVVKGYKSSSDSLLALRGGQCVAAVHDSTLIHPLLRTNPEWADYHAPIATEVPAGKFGGLDPQGRGRHHRRRRQGDPGLAPQRLADSHREAPGHPAAAAAAAGTARQVQAGQLSLAPDRVGKDR